MINIKNLDPNRIKIDQKAFKFFIYHIVYVTVRNLSYRTDNSLNPSYLIINKIDRYIEKSNGIKYLTLVPTDEGRAD